MLLTGCLAHVEHLPPADPTGAESYFSQARDPEVIVGVALAGGGSRAALFAAGGLKALAELRVGPTQRSLLEQVTYLSSVSGGSLAASYFATQKPPRTTPVLTPAGSFTDLNSPRAITQRLAQIPTRFSIESDCDRDLLLAAADKVVLQHKRRIVEFLERP
jgi:predicted acylesterase/phospholipase RssA